MWNYYADMMEKLKIDKPFTTYEEFIEHCVKAKKDGVSRYPVLWVAGVGLEQLPGTWYQMTWNRGGTFFDKQNNHMLGAGSIARETLKWWARPFEKGLDIADPGIGRSSHGPARRSGPARTSIADRTITTWLNVVNDPPTAESRQESRSMARRRGRPSASPTSISPRRRIATRNGPGSCCSISAARPRRRGHARPSSLAKDAMLGSGATTSVMTAMR